MRRSQCLVRDLEHCCDFSIQSAFRAIDTHGEGKIHVQNLIEFQHKFGSHISAREALCVIRRIDVDGDAKINFAEF